MGCEFFTDDDGRVTMIACSRGPKARTCAECRKLNRKRTGTKLCDFKTSSTTTCDEPMCAEHATSVGPDRDLCPTHRMVMAVEGAR